MKELRTRADRPPVEYWADACAGALLVILYATVWAQAHVWSAIQNDDLGLLPHLADRWASGEVPYRDFYSAYPPGAIALPALLFRVFGTTVDVLAHVAAIQYVLFSLAIYLCARSLNRFTAFWSILLYWRYCVRDAGVVANASASIGALVVILAIGRLLAQERNATLSARTVISVAALLSTLFFLHQLVFIAFVAGTAAFLAINYRKSSGKALFLLPATCGTITLTITTCLGVTGADFDLSQICSAVHELYVGFTSRYHRVPIHGFMQYGAILPDYNPHNFRELANFYLDAIHTVGLTFALPVLAVLRGRRILLNVRESNDASGVPQASVRKEAWLLFGLLLLAACSYPTFAEWHRRFYWLPGAAVLLAAEATSPKYATRWIIATILLVTCIQNVRDTRGVLVAQTACTPVRFPAGTLLFPKAMEATQRNLEEIASRTTSTERLLVYPWGPWFHFLLKKKSAVNTVYLTEPLGRPSDLGAAIDVLGKQAALVVVNNWQAHWAQQFAARQPLLPIIMEKYQLVKEYGSQADVTWFSLYEPRAGEPRRIK